MSDTPPQQATAAQKFFGGLMMAIGAIVTLTCGGCTIALIATGMPELLKEISRGQFGMLASLPILLIGIVPALVGVLIFRAGLSQFRPPRLK